MKLINGKETSEKIKEEIAVSVSQRKSKGLKTPHLAAIIVGDNGASRTYVNAKVKACTKVGYESTLIELPEEISEDALLSEIQKLNANKEIDGYIVQLPLPKHIDEQKILLAVDPDKDVDGFHPTNVGRMTLELPSFLPATPYGILELLERHNVETSGRNVVVLGRSHIVGRPISILMSQKRPAGNATVTCAHSRTKDLKELCQQADILVVALGIPEFIKADYIKEGAVIIDVGITRIDDKSKKRGYRIAGDVDFNDVLDKCGMITPVPGGVGPMTIAMLLKNTLQACESRD